jgi:DsbC/DsbD-like thiol-disulfide interchange protein
MFLFTLTLVAVLCWFGAAAQSGDKSDAKVKAAATAKKSGADGKQAVTITLDIDKGWYIYANPLNANTDVLKENVTRVTVKAKDKIQSTVKYPTGKPKMEDKYKFDIYEGKITIQADVQRTMGDVSLLEVSIHVNACRKGECLLPGVIKLKVQE